MVERTKIFRPGYACLNKKGPHVHEHRRYQDVCEICGEDMERCVLEKNWTGEVWAVKFHRWRE